MRIVHHWWSAVHTLGTSGALHALVEWGNCAGMESRIKFVLRSRKSDHSIRYLEICSFI